MPAVSPWPPSPQLLYADNPSGTSTTSTSSATPLVYWGGGTTKSVAQKGIVRVAFASMCSHNSAAAFAMFRLEDSADGVTFAAIEPSSSFDFQFTVANEKYPLAYEFTYSKAAFGLRYLRLVAWQNSVGNTLSFNNGNTGRPSYVRAMVFPTW